MLRTQSHYTICFALQGKYALQVEQEFPKKKNLNQMG